MSLVPAGYLPRVVDAQIERDLGAFGTVCVEGPKWCGKTWASLAHASSVFYVGDPARNFQNRDLAQLDPSSVLAGDEPRLIAEWQEVPELWDAVRFEVDKAGRRGRFLLSGSATPQLKGVMHSGTGRIASIRMRPMSLFESGDSTGEVSLAGLFEEPLQTCATGEVELATLARLIVRGGWPGALGMDASLAAELSQSYLRQLCEQDINRIDGKTRDPHKMQLLMRSLARAPTAWWWCPSPRSGTDGASGFWPTWRGKGGPQGES